MFFVKVVYVLALGSSRDSSTIKTVVFGNHCQQPKKKKHTQHTHARTHVRTHARTHAYVHGQREVVGRKVR